MKNDLPLVPTTATTTAGFLLLVNRATYRARLVTGQALHIADKGQWDIELSGDSVIVSFPRGRVVDPQNRAFVTEMLKVLPARITLSHEHPVNVSSLGAAPRYYIPLPRGCSLTVESALEIKP